MDNPIETAIARIGKLPALPSVMARILALTGDPDTSALELGRYIAADQILSATLLRAANSAAYGYFRQVETITQAIVILGFYEVRNLALAAVAFRAFPKGHPDFDRTHLWRHSLATALIADRLVKQLRFPLESAFMAGLLHDLGKVVLDVLYPDRFHACIRVGQRARRPVRELEPAEFGLTHAQAGAILARHWNLPPALVAAVASHHEADAAQPAAITTLADYLAYQAGFGDPGAAVPPEKPAPRTDVPITDAQLAFMVETIRGQSEQIDELLGALA